MSLQKGKGQYVTIRIDAEMNEALKELEQKTYIGKSSLIRIALNGLLISHNKKPPEFKDGRCRPQATRKPGPGVNR